LVETFDAWESWDVIHSAPEKLRWGIWAYSHAAVKTPTGLKVPVGTYISWANQGPRLLSEDDVHFLATNINAAVTDAKQMTEVYGPTLVYSREAMQWQTEHATPDRDVNEWIDEQMGSLAKWPVPMLSSTRLEWLPQVHSDLFAVQTPSHLSAQNQAALKGAIDRGQAVALVGGFAEGIDASLLKLAGLGAAGSPGPVGLCHAQNQAPELVKNAPVKFDAYCHAESGAQTAGAHAIYTQEGAPALTLETAGGRKVALWNPPDLRPVENIPLKENWGNTGAPYALAAAALSQLLGQNGSLHASQIDLRQTMNLSAWRTKDGVMHILAGNLEEGLRDDADLARHATLVRPQAWRGKPWKDAWSGQTLSAQDGQLTIDLPQAASALLELKR
jgi:hypothetical protein